MTVLTQHSRDAHKNKGSGRRIKNGWMWLIDSVTIEKVESLINSITEDEEEVALGELLSSARKSQVNYGYRVYNITREKRVMPEEINNVLEDDLLVTIFVGDEAPYQEFKWKPKYNGHITRLIMP